LVRGQPLEDGCVTISRAAVSVTFPSRFMLAAAMNTCPCGYFRDPAHDCHCTPPMIQRYVSKIPGPLLDRIEHGDQAGPFRPRTRPDSQSAANHRRPGQFH